MDRDAKKMREDRPFIFTDLKTHKGLDDVVAWLTRVSVLELLNFNL